MSVDVLNHSRLIGLDTAATVRTITAHRKVITAVIDKYRSRVADSLGENILAEVVSVVDAVQSALEIKGFIRGHSTQRYSMIAKCFGS